MTQHVTAVILTLNEEEHIVDCIKSLDWTDQVLVFDSHSEDETVALAQQAGAVVTQSAFENYAQQRNAALDYLSSTDWVFFIDADERCTPELATEIQEKIETQEERGWYVPRHNYIFGNVTLGAGWYPDYQLRLFKFGSVHYERPVHELAVVDGEIGHLERPLIHHNYRDTAHFHDKQRRYTRYDVGILHRQGSPVHGYTPYTQAVRHFWWRYITLGGYRIGWHGLRLSIYMAYYEWLKYRWLKRRVRGEEELS